MKNFEEIRKPIAQESTEPVDIVTVRPATDSLLYPEDDGFPWPKDVIDNKDLKDQSESRRELMKSLDSIFNIVSNVEMDITEAIQSGQIDPEKLAETYKQLSKFLENETSAERILLYFPFELIPPQSWRPESKALSLAVMRFLETYKQKWLDMLLVHDVRANFVDGDVLEPELRSGPIPRVSKVAHFIPILIQKGVLTTKEVIGIVQDSDDDILRESITSALTVAGDMNLLSREDTERMEESSDKQLQDLAKSVKDKSVAPEKAGGETAGEKTNNEEAAANSERNYRWLSSLTEDIKKDLRGMQIHHDERLDSVTKARSDWEYKVDENAIIDKYAKEISTAISSDSISSSDIEKFLSANTEKIYSHICITAIGKSLENLAATDAKMAQEKYASFKPSFDKMWKSDEPEIQDAIERVLSRLSVLNVISKADLDTFGAQLPIFDEDPLAGKESMKIKFTEIASSIESDPKLSKYVFPIIIAYGSKIKGYGKRVADIDIAVFVKPDVDMADRPHMEKLLDGLCETHGIKDLPLEFWLENDSEKSTEIPKGKNAEKEAGLKYRIKDFPRPDKLLGDSGLTHVLFNGVWCGNKDAVQELYAKLLTGYLAPQEELVTENQRLAWLEEMERDSLQYRLMHRGYANFYPEKGGIRTKHSDMIDSESTFWDSGYRRLATKLYLKKVFLPELS